MGVRTCLHGQGATEDSGAVSDGKRYRQLQPQFTVPSQLMSSFQHAQGRLPPRATRLRCMRDGW